MSTAKDACECSILIASSGRRFDTRRTQFQHLLPQPPSVWEAASGTRKNRIAPSIIIFIITCNRRRWLRRERRKFRTGINWTGASACTENGAPNERRHRNARALKWNWNCSLKLQSKNSSRNTPVKVVRAAHRRQRLSIYLYIWLHSAKQIFRYLYHYVYSFLFFKPGKTLWWIKNYRKKHKLFGNALHSGWSSSIKPSCSRTEFGATKIR